MSPDQGLHLHSSSSGSIVPVNLSLSQFSRDFYSYAERVNQRYPAIIYDVLKPRVQSSAGLSRPGTKRHCVELDEC